MARASSSTPVVSRFEFWPAWLFYLPVAAHYTWLAIRYRSATLPSAANPSIYSGGICRESKSQILSLVGESQRHRVARWAVVRFAESPGRPPREIALEAMTAAGLSFPLVAKPDEGQRGDGVQLLRDEAALDRYLESFPPDVPLVLQALADLPHEAGVLYYRIPSEPKGRILSITLKELPSVTGDGKRTLRELILADERARLVPHLYFRRHAERLDQVVPAGKSIRLVFSGNHCQGAIFRNGTAEATDAMRDAMGAVADSMSEFYFGRYDIKFRDLESLKRGEDFLIVEINGASAESTHIWDASMTLWGAYRALFEQFSVLFRIGNENRRRGFKPIGGLAILKDFRTYLRQRRQYPPTS
ncbi:D-alanine--D-alanine ligase [bacterium]|nr:D-alanine--D-alanine ligase [bacterium]